MASWGLLAIIVNFIILSLSILMRQINDDDDGCILAKFFFVYLWAGME